MTTINDGGPAFPTPHGNLAGGEYGSEGMTLRDRFAMQAMLQGAASFRTEAGSDGDMDGYARWCYAMADAMLDARDHASVEPCKGCLDCTGYEPSEFPIYVDAQGNEHAEF